MAIKSYADKLKHPKWQKKRLDIMNRDNFACCECGDKDTMLNVHHFIYKNGREPWDYDDTNFSTLCEVCHKTYHDIVNDLKLAGFEVVRLFSMMSPIGNIRIWIALYHNGSIVDSTIYLRDPITKKLQPYASLTETFIFRMYHEITMLKNG